MSFKQSNKKDGRTHAGDCNVPVVEVLLDGSVDRVAAEQGNATLDLVKGHHSSAAQHLDRSNDKQIFYFVRQFKLEFRDHEKNFRKIVFQQFFANLNYGSFLGAFNQKKVSIGFVLKINGFDF